MRSVPSVTILCVRWTASRIGVRCVGSQKHQVEVSCIFLFSHVESILYVDPSFTCRIDRCHQTLTGCASPPVACQCRSMQTHVCLVVNRETIGKPSLHCGSSKARNMLGPVPQKDGRRQKTDV
eukprot:2631755-Prymnesium_polylepis.1